MQRWFVILLMLVLPLRGVVGDAMAAGMLAQHLGMGAQVAAPAAAAAHHDCMEHGAGGVQAEPAGAPLHAGVDADCSTCATCQACSAVSLPLPTAALLLDAAPQAGPVASERGFASAVPPQGLKPPIS